MTAQSNFLENMLIDGIFRGGALNAAGTLNSAAVVTGIWAASTAVTLGQTFVPHANMTAAGGKILRVTTAGTTGTNNALAIPAVGSTLADGTATYTIVSVIPSLLSVYAALFVASRGARQNSTAYTTGQVVHLTANGGTNGDNRAHLYNCTTAGTTAGSQTGYLGVPGEVIADGTAVFTELSVVIDTNTGFPAGLAEVTGGSYARVAVACSLTAWAGTQAAASTTASTGVSGTTSNNAVITFPAPTADWSASPAMVGAVLFYDQLTGGNLIDYAVLTTPQAVLNGQLAPTFAAAGFTFQIDN